MFIIMGLLVLFVILYLQDVSTNTTRTAAATADTKRAYPFTYGIEDNSYLGNSDTPLTDTNRAQLKGKLKSAEHKYFESPHSEGNRFIVDSEL